METTPAERQAEASADVERIARDLLETYESNITVVTSDVALRIAVLSALRRDVIRVGQRPIVERPIEGQTTIDEQLAAPEGEDA